MALLVNLKKFINNKNNESEKSSNVQDEMNHEPVRFTSAVKNKVPDSGKEEKLALLTPRERELLVILLDGYTLQESADKLSIKYPTANTHITSIYKKLGVTSRAELIIKYREHND